MVYKLNAWLDIFSILIELVILLGSVLGKITHHNHQRDRKSKLFMVALGSVLIATTAECIWNFLSGKYFNEAFAISIVLGTIIFGILSEVFVFYYMVALYFERFKVNILWVYFMISGSIGCIVFALWGTAAGKILIYSFNHIYHGPYFSKCLHLFLIIGVYSIVFILWHSRRIGFKDTLISLSYYVCPMVAIIMEIHSSQIEMILPSAAISMLILNNLLQGDEIRKAENRQEIAEESEKNKSRFLANMSHEIRTPINAVLGLNEMIIRESKDADIVAYARDIKSAGGTLLNLVNEVLDFSKIESGKMELVEIDYDISSVLNDLVNMINGKAEEKGLSFELDVDGTIPRILHGDEVRIKQIITNILSNAVKYTKIGTVKLTVKYTKVDEFAIDLFVSVEDTGMGMKPEEVANLFTPFSRLDEKKNNSIEGTGLGMSITKYFLGLMNSELIVDTVYGGGSTFSFTVRQEVKNWEGMGDYKDAFERLRRKGSDYKVKLIAPDAKILVVDDMPMNLTVCRGLLKSTRVQVDTASSGEEALELMHYTKFDLIYLDHMMPGLDGIETLKKLKEDETSLNLNTPVVVLTANAVSGAREMYMDEGFNDYLTKPINPEKLEKSLIKFLPVELVTELDSQAEESVVYDDASVVGTSQIDLLRRIPLLSVDDGIQASGDEEVYLIAGKEFTLTIQNCADKIYNYWQEGDIHNYEVQVHGLKSASRIMGDLTLSEMAKELEFAAKDQKTDIINEKTQALLDRYMELKGYLEPVFIEEHDQADLPEIDSQQLKEAIEVIKQGIDEFDFDMVGSVMEQLSEMKLPADFQEVYKKMEVLMAEVDYDGMSELFKNI